MKLSKAVLFFEEEPDLVCTLFYVLYCITINVLVLLNHKDFLGQASDRAKPHQFYVKQRHSADVNTPCNAELTQLALYINNFSEGDSESVDVYSIGGCTLQGGSDISGTLSRLQRHIKKSTSLPVISR